MLWFPGELCSKPRSISSISLCQLANFLNAHNNNKKTKNPKKTEYVRRAMYVKEKCVLKTHTRLRGLLQVDLSWRMNSTAQLDAARPSNLCPLNSLASLC